MCLSQLYDTCSCIFSTLRQKNKRDCKHALVKVSEKPMHINPPYSRYVQLPLIFSSVCCYVASSFYSIYFLCFSFLRVLLLTFSFFSSSVVSFFFLSSFSPFIIFIYLSFFLLFSSLFLICLRTPLNYTAYILLTVELNYSTFLKGCSSSYIVYSRNTVRNKFECTRTIPKYCNHR